MKMHGRPFCIWRNCSWNAISEGRRSFWKVMDGYLRHEINIYRLEEIIKEGLKDEDGSIKGLLSIFGIEERDYKKFLNFLQKQGIKLKELRNSPYRKNFKNPDSPKPFLEAELILAYFLT